MRKDKEIRLVTKGEVIPVKWLSYDSQNEKDYEFEVRMETKGGMHLYVSPDSDVPTVSDPQVSDSIAWEIGQEVKDEIEGKGGLAKGWIVPEIYLPEFLWKAEDRMEVYPM